MLFAWEPLALSSSHSLQTDWRASTSGKLLPSDWMWRDMYQIALVEDHARLAELIRSALRAVDIRVDVFSTIEAAWVALRETEYSALVIDRGLPDGDGLVLVKRLRAINIGTPCLMLTSCDALHDRFDGLKSGANDYLTKPFSMGELVVRVRALTPRLAEPGTTPAKGDASQAAG